jgi:hypothetical protein
MEIVYSIFIGMISSKIARKIDGIGLQCRRDRPCLPFRVHGTAKVPNKQIQASATLAMSLRPFVFKYSRLND